EQIIPRLKEILAKPDPALGYFNGDLRFWLGWAQQVAGDHDAAQESWRQARSELEPFLQKQPNNFYLMGYLALTNMGLGDKAAAIRASHSAPARPARIRRTSDTTRRAPATFFPLRWTADRDIALRES